MSRFSVYFHIAGYTLFNSCSKLSIKASHATYSKECNLQIYIHIVYRNGQFMQLQCSMSSSLCYGSVSSCLSINQPTMYPIKEIKNNWLTNFPVIYSKKIIITKMPSVAFANNYKSTIKATTMDLIV